MVILLLLWIFLKLRERGIINIFIVCNFVNMVRVNLIIHLVKHIYMLYSLSKSLQFGE